MQQYRHWQKINSQLTKDVSDKFFNLSYDERSFAIGKAVGRIATFIKLLKDNYIFSYDLFEKFLAKNDQKLILMEYFGLREEDLNIYVGDTFRKFLNINFSNDGHYVILHYSTNFAVKSISKTFDYHNRPKWSMEMRVCRGIVFDLETLECVSLPYEKYFNIGEYADTELENFAEKLTSSSFSAEEKVDGVLIQAFYDVHNDSIKVCTKQILDRGKGAEEDSKFIQLAYKLYDWNNQQLKQLLKASRYSLIFEMVDKSVRIVIDYKNSGLVLHGIRNTKSFGMVPTEFLDSFGFKKPASYVFSSFEELDEFRKNAQEDIEGVVIKFYDGSAMKVKTTKYFARHAGLAKLNYKNIGESILREENWDTFKFETIKDEELFDIADEYRKRLYVQGNKFVSHITDFYKYYDSMYADDRFVKEECRKWFDKNIDDPVITSNVDFGLFSTACGHYRKWSKTKNENIKNALNKDVMKMCIKCLENNLFMGSKINEHK